MKKIGIIGGLSWVSTADYYKRLNEETQARLGGVSSPPLVIESVDRQQYVDAVIERGDEAAACRQIREAAQALERAGAAFIVISCNDVHRFVPEIEPHIGISFLHIADATGAAIQQMGLKTVGLLGVRKTMEGDFYPDILAKRGVRTLAPDEPDRTTVHDKIYDELVMNRFTDATRAAYVDIIERLGARGAEGVVLGCTEIPLLLTPGQIPMPSFSTTELHCKAAIEMALG